MAVTSAYVHIPFCRRRCYYCDFPVSVVGDRKWGDDSQMITHYVEVLAQEISQSENFGDALNTVFFGGGTPSLLSVGQLEKVLATLDQQFGISDGAEISIEIDPGTFNLEQLQGYVALGVNRLSLGVQAFQTELLQKCGRTHTVADIHEAVALIRRVGVENFSLDLISGLPQQTMADWLASLQSAIALGPAHISCYDLIVEPVTAFGRQYEPGMAPLPSDTLAAAMYRMAQQTLSAAGYDHYEISNYARPGFQCRHNRVYWENQPFYGFGMGAASYLRGDRVTRPRKTTEYYTWVKQEMGKCSLPAVVDPREVLLDTLMLGLRLAEGLDIAKLVDRFGEGWVVQIWQSLQPHFQKGWVKYSGETSHLGGVPISGRLLLTDPEGFLFSNTILSDLFAQLS